MNGLQSATPTSAGLSNAKMQPRQLQVLQADNGFVVSDNYNYPNIHKVATDFDSMVAILKEYFN